MRLAKGWGDELAWRWDGVTLLWDGIEHGEGEVCVYVYRSGTGIPNSLQAAVSHAAALLLFEILISILRRRSCVLWSC